MAPCVYLQNTIPEKERSNGQSMTKKVHIRTFGCQMNQADTNGRLICLAFMEKTLVGNWTVDLGENTIVGISAES